MLRSILLFVCLLTLGCMAQSMAQSEVLGLQPDPGKLQQARALESRAVSAKDSLLLGKAYFLFAEAFHVGGQQATAKDYYLKTIHTLTPKGDFYEVGMAYLRLNEGIHLTPQSRQDFDNALVALAIFRRMHSPGGMARAYNYLTSAYKRSWVWRKEEIDRFKSDPAKQDTLYQCINNIERYGRQAKDTVMMAEANLQRADLLRHLKNELAFSYFNTALQFFYLQKNDVSVVHTLCHMAATYMDFKQYKRAGNLLDQAQALTDAKSLKEYLALTHLLEVKRDFYHQTSQWRLAYETMHGLVYLYTYRVGGERDALVSSINLRYETEKKEALLRVQATELKTLQVQRLLTIALSALLITTAVMSFVFFRLSRKNQRISRQNQELVKEQNHRVKNNLQEVSSLLSLQASQLTDETARQAVEESHLRVQSMAILHHKLYDGERLAKVDLEDFIPELVSGVLQTFGIVNVEPHYAIDPIFLSADKATPLSLILNELITNACKYAFLGNASPRLRVSCQQKGHTIHFEVTDNGPGLPQGQITAIPLDDLLRTQSKTFGIPLIQSQVLQLNAVGRFETNREGTARGTKFSLDFNT